MTDDSGHTHRPNLSEAELRDAFDAQNYVAEDEIVTTVQLALHLGKPLLVEGPPGAGKTELAKVLSQALDTDLIRLQCYEGLAAENALYEWNYTKQLLTIQAKSNDIDDPAEGTNTSVFSEEYLLERPLLQALRSDADQPPVLLIDEVDRADEEFEALLLEILSDFQVSVPELGTVRATVPPIVVITSNRTRGLSDALKRRCLYLYIEPPSFEKEYEIIRQKVPSLTQDLSSEIVGIVQHLREEPLRKQPGVSETLDWARALVVLQQNDVEELSTETVHRTLGCLLKEAEDINHVDEDLLDELILASKQASTELSMETEKDSDAT